MDDGNILEENAPEELFTNPQNPRLQEFLSKVLEKVLTNQIFGIIIL